MMGLETRGAEALGCLPKIALAFGCRMVAEFRLMTFQDHGNSTLFPRVLLSKGKHNLC